MKLENNYDFKINRTWKYLYPCLLGHGDELKDYLNSLFKIAIGIGDVLYGDAEDTLFILVNSNASFLSEKGREKYRKNFEVFLEWLQDQDFYIDDYMYDDKTSHMVLIKVPEKYSQSYSKFKSSKYSEMYSEKDIKNLFKIVELQDKKLEQTRNERTFQLREILTKSKNYLPYFVEEVNERFDTLITKEDFKDAELDFNINFEEEVF